VADVLEHLKATLSDRYRIERELGRGGMATVYLAEDLKHHRKVAVKVLRPELAAVLGADRFLKEIEVTAHLQHPHILPLFDSGEADGFLYYVAVDKGLPEAVRNVGHTMTSCGSGLTYDLERAAASYRVTVRLLLSG
jgi:serine/threonine protein kinase